MAQTKTITGVVVDATGEPVIGASVLEVGTTNGTITDVDGNFTIQVPVGAKLDVSYIGYKTQQIVVGVPNTYKVILKEDAEMLDEVVVTGYGMSQKRSLMTNSISKLDDKVLQNAAMSNAAQSLQGTVSGLRVTNTSGKPGSSPNIVLRGGASINKNLEGPLVVVDGLVRSMDDINPSDIESIQVLKDAASTAIYGARANNGVILVTTKKGVEGRTQITYKFKGGVNFAREGYKYLDAGDYLYYQRLGWQRTNGGTSMENQKGFGVNSGVDLAFMTDANKHLLNEGWRSMADPVDPDKTLIFRNHAGELHDLTFRNAAFTQDHYLNLSGGNDKGTFSSSLGYYSEDGQIISTNYQRVNGTINGSYKLLPVLTVNAGGSFSWSKMPDLWTYDLKSPWNGETGEYELFYRTMSMFPTWNPWNEDGSPAAGWSNQDGNPYYWKDKLTRSTTNRKTSFNIGFALEILPQQLFLNGNSSMYYTQ